MLGLEFKFQFSLLHSGFSQQQPKPRSRQSKQQWVNSGTQLFSPAEWALV